MKRWMGRWLLAVSLIHTLFGVIVFRETLTEIVRAGFFNTVGVDPMRGGVAWFLLWGFLLFTLALLMDWIETRSVGALPLSFGWSLLIFTGIGILLMPASGIFLVLPPAIAILYTHYSPSRR